MERSLKKNTVLALSLISLSSACQVQASEWIKIGGVVAGAAACWSALNSFGHAIKRPHFLKNFDLYNGFKNMICEDDENKGVKRAAVLSGGIFGLIFSPTLMVPIVCAARYGTNPPLNVSDIIYPGLVTLAGVTLISRISGGIDYVAARADKHTSENAIQTRVGWTINNAAYVAGAIGTGLLSAYLWSRRNSMGAVR